MAAVGLVAFSCTFPDYTFETEPAETCDNDISDGNETGIDCGGDCTPCPCDEDEDCGTDEVCEDGDCRGPCANGECPPTPTCFDGDKNGDETDEDCGGSCEAKCAIGDDCEIGGDCVEKVCDETCQPPTCEDGVHNGFEPWIDCGGDCEVDCANGEPCYVNDDCESDTCVETAADQSQCAPPFCKNSKVDPGETDIDCGGDDCPKCGENKMCGEDADCAEGVCGDDGICAAPECDDTVKNGDETDTDCGGGEPMGCAPCDVGDSCEGDSDCAEKVCAVPDDCEDEVCDKECLEPACDDTVRNGTESDVDCGGECNGCPWGGDCRENDDCALEICDRNPEAEDIGECVSCDDDEQNGLELGLDCGGPDCALCQPGDECSEDPGCLNYLCDGGECVTGLELDYHCGQCGEQPNDQIKFFVRLRNLSSEPIDVSDVSVRYYLSTEADTANFDLLCEYMGERCGAQTLTEYTTPNDTDTTHVFETQIGSDETIPGNGSAELEITIRLNGTTVDQQDDYSFALGTDYHSDWEAITLHRQGTKIWGTEP